MTDVAVNDKRKAKGESVNLFRISLMTVLLGLANVAQATDEPKFVSKTFQEIQSRVLRRDAESGAILQVKVKEDAPQLSFGLDFTIEEMPDGRDAIVVLSRNLKAGDGVYEKYLLRLDDALRQELQNQKRVKELRVERNTKNIEEQKKKITELSGGKLSYGMSLEEVVKVKGQPQNVHSWQAAGAFIAIYPGMSLDFWAMKLTRAELARE